MFCDILTNLPPMIPRTCGRCLFLLSTLLHLLLLPSSSSAPPPLLIDPHPLLRRSPSLSAAPQQYLDPTLPPIRPATPPLLSLPLLLHDFAHTYGSPPTSVNFTIPTTLPRCSLPVLHFSASCAGDQYDRIAAVWIDRIEILRTSTAEPTASGVFWNIHKDLSRYSSILTAGDHVVTVMLENIVNDVYTGIYHVNVSLHFYAEELGFHESNKKPADLIVPIANKEADDGFWFRIQNAGDAHAESVRIPENSYRAVLEVFVSFHGNDEFWYSNPPNSYIEQNHLPTSRGNGSFREVFAMIDGVFVGSVVPFPVIFTGGINPLFWEPVVAIGAFDLPSYDLELTPFLESLLDGGMHEFALGVSDGISFWLVDANLHLWLDPYRDSVEAKLVEYNAEPGSITRKSKFQGLDGKFEIKADRELRFAGWVNSSLGNLTTSVVRETGFKSSVVFKNNGKLKEVKMTSKSTSEFKVAEENGILLRANVYRKTKFPIRFVTETISGKNSSMYRLKTDLEHSLHDSSWAIYDGVSAFSRLNDKQSGTGWMDVEDHSVLAGSTSTNQSYYYTNGDSCYLRTLTVQDGEIVDDEISSSCASVM